MRRPKEGLDKSPAAVHGNPKARQEWACEQVKLSAKDAAWLADYVGVRDLVKAANNGKGVDVVFDPVGGDATEPAFRSLGWNGRHLVVGFTGGIAAVRTNLPLLKGANLMGVDLRQFGINEPDRARRNMREVLALGGLGALHPAIARTYPLEDFAAAMTAAASGADAGRIVLTMD